MNPKKQAGIVLPSANKKIDHEVDERFYQELKEVSLSLFRKDMIGIFHGSISAKIGMNKFLINSKDAIFDDLKDDDLMLLYHSKDYRWKEASIDAPIHSQIYQSIADAKFILYAMPPYISGYALNHDFIQAKDYFGKKLFNKINIYDPKNLDDWYDRAEVEISRYMIETNSNIMVIRGYGVYAHARDLHQLVKTIAILENSCKLLKLNSVKENV